MSRLISRVGAVVGALGLAALTSAPLHAQATPRDGENTGAWLIYVGEHPVAGKVGVHAEGQWRVVDGLADPQQLLLRGGLLYDVRPDVRLTGGYAYIRTYEYGELPSAGAFDEHRVWQQLQLAQRTGPVAWTHRYRLEQRWIDRGSARGAAEDFDLRHRVRYLVRATLPLGAASYLTVYDEPMINVGQGARGNAFDQNRAYAAVGFRIGASHRIELGYLNQLVSRQGGAERETNHLLQAALFSRASLR